MTSTLMIATRESPLALCQARAVKAALEAAHPGLTVGLLGLTTAGDRFLETPLYNHGGKGLFVRELEEALLDNRADIAVHSMKDVPMVLPAGLVIGAYCARVDPRDVLVSVQHATYGDLPEGARVGTSSLRRQSQLYHLRRDLRVEALRGNVNTRLQKLQQGEFAAIVLAAAGLQRLGIVAGEGLQISPFPTAEMLPAAGQGVLGIECREEDRKTLELLQPLGCRDSELRARAERALCRHLGGSCDIPLGSHAEMTGVQGEEILLRACVGSPDGKYLLHAEKTGAHQAPEMLGMMVAEDLLSRGAAALLAGLDA